MEDKLSQKQRIRIETLALVLAHTQGLHPKTAMTVARLFAEYVEHDRIQDLPKEIAVVPATAIPPDPRPTQ